jgi:hypothetical protein
MDRCRSCFSFAAWFTGIGYVVLWPLTANGDSGYPFGASVVCGHANGGVLAALCGLPHPLALPVGVHVLGFVAAMLITVHLLGRLLRCVRPRLGAVAAAALRTRLSRAVLRRPRKPARGLRSVPPRKHFGLRGVPR